MPSDPLQIAYRDWSRRAAQFRSAGVPDATWTALYQRDIQDVYRGKTGLTDGEVYAGVASAQGVGPAIQDPTQATYSAGNFISNIGHDIAGIITGFPHGTAHLAAPAGQKPRHHQGLWGEIMSGVSTVPFVGNLMEGGRALGEAVEGKNPSGHLAGMLPFVNTVTGAYELATGGKPYEPNVIPMTETSGILLEKIAQGDNNWLAKQGYINQGDKVHGGWQSLGIILRALNNQPNENILPYAPVITALAESTNGQGRNQMLQHPVSTLIDVLPVVSGLGKLAIGSRDFSMIPREQRLQFRAQSEQDLANGKISQQEHARNLKRAPLANEAEPRFYAAGVAVRRGNPVKALISVGGDIIPGGRSAEWLTKITARQRFNLFAEAFGANVRARLTLGGLATYVNELDQQVWDWYRYNFGDSLDIEPRRIEYIWRGMAALVNPETGLPFRSWQEQQHWRQSFLSEPENAIIDRWRDIGEAQRKRLISMHDLMPVEYPSFDEQGNYTGFSRLEYMPRTSQTVRALKAKDHWQEMTNTHLQEWQNATDIATKDQAWTRYNEDLSNLVKAGLKFDQLRGLREKDTPGEYAFTGTGVEFPGEWNSPLTWYFRRGAHNLVHTLLSGQRLEEALNILNHAITRDDFARAFGGGDLAKGQHTFDLMMNEAVRYWHLMSSSAGEETAAIEQMGLPTPTYGPIFRFDANPHDVERMIEKPGMGNVLKPENPAAVRQRQLGLDFSSTHFDIRIELTKTQVEILRRDFANHFLQHYVLPRSYDKREKLREIQIALQNARQVSRKPLPSPDQYLQTYYRDFNPKDYGLRSVDLKSMNGVVIERDLANLLQDALAPDKFRHGFGKLVIGGHTVYKNSVLTGPRHLAHVFFGSALFMGLSQPSAVLQLVRAARMWKLSHLTPDELFAEQQRQMGPVGSSVTPKQARAAKRFQASDPGIFDLGVGTQFSDPTLHYETHATLGGLKQPVHELAPGRIRKPAKTRIGRALQRSTGRPVWNNIGPPEQGFTFLAAQNQTDALNVSWFHEARQRGIDIATYIPNKLSHMEEFIVSVAKIATALDNVKKGMDGASAVQAASKLFVDINNMSIMERTWIKQLFPFYAFTRHLFRYLFNYPVDHPYRAAILTNAAEQEQADWKNGLPRSFMSLYYLGDIKPNGNLRTVDLKNTNPFRSFSSDFSWAGVFSSFSPWLTAPLSAIGVRTLSGTTQLYPGVQYDAFSGTLKATPQPGWIGQMAESFIPETGLLDHYMKLTKSTQLLAQHDHAAYEKQLYNMINVPFVPEVINVPYEQEITEMRRFRAAQSYVSIVKQSPTAENISKLLTYNAVPFDNTLIAPGPLAAYYASVKDALDAAGEGFISPAAATPPPKRQQARFQSFYDVAQQAGAASQEGAAG